MKILHVETGRHLYGGPQQVVYLVRALRDMGHDNTLVCPPGSGIDSAARAAGIPVRNLFCAGDLDLPFAYRLTQYISETKPDVVHCHSRRGADILGGLAASFADVPAVVSRRVDNTEMRLVAALRYRPFRKVIAISEAIAAVLRDHGVEPERLTVIRSAVDTAEFEKHGDCAALRTELGIPGDVTIIAAAGQLIPRKGHAYLLQAMAELQRERSGLRLLIFGDGYLVIRSRGMSATFLRAPVLVRATVVTVRAAEDHLGIPIETSMTWLSVVSGVLAVYLSFRLCAALCRQTTRRTG